MVGIDRTYQEEGEQGRLAGGTVLGQQVGRSEVLQINGGIKFYGRGHAEGVVGEERRTLGRVS